MLHLRSQWARVYSVLIYDTRYDIEAYIVPAVSVPIYNNLCDIWVAFGRAQLWYRLRYVLISYIWATNERRRNFGTSW